MLVCDRLIILKSWQFIVDKFCTKLKIWVTNFSFCLYIGFSHSEHFVRILSFFMRQLNNFRKCGFFLCSIKKLDSNNYCMLLRHFKDPNWVPCKLDHITKTKIRCRPLYVIMYYSIWDGITVELCYAPWYWPTVYTLAIYGHFYPSLLLWSIFLFDKLPIICLWLINFTIFLHFKK